MSGKRTIAGGVLVGLFALAGVAAAQNATWIGADPNWATGTNWSTGLEPGAGTVAVFDSSGTSLMVDLEGALGKQAQQIRFTGSADGYDVANGGLSLATGGGLEQSGTFGTNTISAQVSGANLGIAVSGGTLRLNGENTGIDGASLATVAAGTTLELGRADSLGDADVRLDGGRLYLARAVEPIPIFHRDIGAPVPGSWSEVGGVHTVQGNGDDIWDTTDDFHYVYRQFSGDGEMTARVLTLQNTNEWAKAGVMFRESLTTGSRHVMSCVTPGQGGSFQRRVTTDSTSDHTTPGNGHAAPYWVRIVRAGDLFTTYDSADGATWNQLGSVTIDMPDDLYLGLALTSHSQGVLTTATFDNVSAFGPTISIDYGNDVTVTSDSTVEVENLSEAFMGALNVHGGAGLSLKGDITFTGTTFTGGPGRVVRFNPEAGTTSSLGLVDDGAVPTTIRVTGPGTIRATDANNVLGQTTLDIPTGVFRGAGAGPTGSSVDAEQIVLSGGTLFIEGGLGGASAGLNGDYFDFTPTRDMVGTGPDGEDEWSVFTSVQNVEAWRVGRTPTQEAVLTDPIDFPAGGGEDAIDGGNPFDSIGINVGIDNLVAFWEGGIEIPADGLYTFYTASDDGSFLIIDDTMVVKNAEWQGIGGSEQTGSITLTAGRHDILVGLYEGGGGVGILASWESADAGIPKTVIPANVFHQGGRGSSARIDSSLHVTADSTIDGTTNMSFAGTTTIGAGVTLSVLPSSPTRFVSFDATSLGGDVTFRPTGELRLGTVSKPAGPLRLTKDGSGMLTLDDLSGASDLSGVTPDVQEGRLVAVAGGGATSLDGVDTVELNGGILKLTADPKITTASNAPQSDRIVAHWGFENNVADTTGTYDGTIMGGAAFTDEGINGSALTFDGIDDFVDLPNGFADFAGGVTIAAWVKTEALPFWARVVDFGNGEGVDNILMARRDTSQHYRLEFHDYDASGGNTWQHNVDNVFELNTWQHIVGVVDAQTRESTIYLDGNAISFQSNAQLPRTVTRANNYIGESGWAQDGFFQGVMDEIFIYDVGLTGPEVQQLMTWQPLPSATTNYNVNVDVRGDSGVEVDGDVSAGTVELYEGAKLSVGGSGAIRFKSTNINFAAANVTISSDAEMYAGVYRDGGGPTQLTIGDGNGQVIFDEGGFPGPQDGSTFFDLQPGGELVLVQTSDPGRSPLPAASFIFNGGTLVISSADGNDVVLPNPVFPTGPGGVIAKQAGSGAPGPVTVSIANELYFNPGDTFTLAAEGDYHLDVVGSIITGAIAKKGDGLVTINGQALYDEGTTVEEGRLLVNGLLAATSHIDVTGGWLDANGPVSLMANSPGDVGMTGGRMTVAGTLDANGLDVGTGAELEVASDTTVSTASLAGTTGLHGELFVTGAGLTVTDGVTTADQNVSTTFMDISGGQFDANADLTAVNEVTSIGGVLNVAGVLSAHTLTVDGGTVNVPGGVQADTVDVLSGLLNAPTAPLTLTSLTVEGGQADLAAGATVDSVEVQGGTLTTGDLNARSLRIMGGTTVANGTLTVDHVDPNDSSNFSLNGGATLVAADGEALAGLPNFTIQGSSTLDFAAPQTNLPVVTVVTGNLLVGDMTGVGFKGADIYNPNDPAQANVTVVFEDGAAFGPAAGSPLPNTDDLGPNVRLTGAIVGGDQTFIVGDDGNPSLKTDIYSGVSFGPWTTSPFHGVIKEAKAGQGFEVAMNGQDVLLEKVGTDSPELWTTNLATGANFTGRGKLTITARLWWPINKVKTITRTGIPAGQVDDTVNDDIIELAGDDIFKFNLKTLNVHHGRLRLSDPKGLGGATAHLRDDAGLVLDELSPTSGTVHVHETSMVWVNTPDRLSGGTIFIWEPGVIFGYQAGSVDPTAARWPKNAHFVADGGTTDLFGGSGLVVSDGAQLVNSRDFDAVAGGAGITALAASSPGDAVGIGATDGHEYRVEGPLDLGIAGGGLDVTVGSDAPMLTLIGGGTAVRTYSTLNGSVILRDTGIVGDMTVKSGRVRVDFDRGACVWRSGDVVLADGSQSEQPMFYLFEDGDGEVTVDGVIDVGNNGLFTTHENAATVTDKLADPDPANWLADEIITRDGGATYLWMTTAHHDSAIPGVGTGLIVHQKMTFTGRPSTTDRFYSGIPDAVRLDDNRAGLSLSVFRNGGGDVWLPNIHLMQADGNVPVVFSVRPDQPNVYVDLTLHDDATLSERADSFSGDFSLINVHPQGSRSLAIGEVGQDFLDMSVYGQFGDAGGDLTANLVNGALRFRDSSTIAPGTVVNNLGSFDVAGAIGEIEIEMSDSNVPLDAGTYRLSGAQRMTVSLLADPQPETEWTVSAPIHVFGDSNPNLPDAYVSADAGAAPSQGAGATAHFTNIQLETGGVLAYGDPGPVDVIFSGQVNADGGISNDSNGTPNAFVENFTGDHELALVGTRTIRVSGLITTDAFTAAVLDPGDPLQRTEFLAGSIVASSTLKLNGPTHFDPAATVNANDVSFGYPFTWDGSFPLNIGTGHVRSQVVLEQPMGGTHWQLETGGELVVNGVDKLSGSTYAFNGGQMTVKEDGDAALALPVGVGGAGTLRVERLTPAGLTDKTLGFGNLSFTGSGPSLDITSGNEYDVTFAATSVAQSATVQVLSAETDVDLGPVTFGQPGSLQVEAEAGATVRLGALTGDGTHAVNFGVTIPDGGELVLGDSTNWGGQVFILGSWLRVEKQPVGYAAGSFTNDAGMNIAGSGPMDLTSYSARHLKLSGDMQGVIAPARAVKGELILNHAGQIDAGFGRDDGAGGRLPVVLEPDALSPFTPTVRSEAAGATPADFAAPLEIVGETLLGDLAGGEDFGISGPVSGTGGLHKVGGETVTLGGTNSYLDDTLVSEGTVVMASLKAFGNGANVDLDGGTVSVAVAGANFNVGAGGYASTLDPNSRFRVDAIGADLTDVAVGDGTLAAHVDMTGVTPPAAPITGTFEINTPSITAGYPVGLSGTIRADADASVGSVQDSSDVTFQAGQTLTITSDVALASGRVWTVDYGTVEVTGDVTTGLLSKAGGGTLLLSGNNTAKLSVLQIGPAGPGGTVIAADAAAAPDVVRVKAGGVYSVLAANHDYAKVDPTDSNGVVALSSNSNATISFAGADENLTLGARADATFDGTLNPGEAAGVPRYSFGGGGATLRLESVLTDVAGPTEAQFGWVSANDPVDEGTVVIAAQNTLSGDVHVHMPIVYDSGVADPFPNVDGAANFVYLYPDGSLDLAGSTAPLDNVRSLGGGLSNSNGTLDAATMAAVFELGDYVVGGEGAQTTVADGALDRPGANLRKIGPSRVELALPAVLNGSQNVFGSVADGNGGPGATVVEAGTLVVGDLTSLGRTTALEVQSGAVAELPNGGTYVYDPSDRASMTLRLRGTGEVNVPAGRTLDLTATGGGMELTDGGWAGDHAAISGGGRVDLGSDNTVTGTSVVEITGNSTLATRYEATTASRAFVVHGGSTLELAAFGNGPRIGGIYPGAEVDFATTSGALVQTARTFELLVDPNGPASSLSYPYIIRVGEARNGYIGLRTDDPNGHVITASVTDGNGLVQHPTAYIQKLGNGTLDLGRTLLNEATPDGQKVYWIVWDGVLSMRTDQTNSNALGATAWDWVNGSEFAAERSPSMAYKHLEGILVRNGGTLNWGGVQGFLPDSAWRSEASAHEDGDGWNPGELLLEDGAGLSGGGSGLTLGFTDLVSGQTYLAYPTVKQTRPFLPSVTFGGTLNLRSGIDVDAPSADNLFRAVVDGTRVEFTGDLPGAKPVDQFVILDVRKGTAALYQSHQNVVSTTIADGGTLEFNADGNGLSYSAVHLANDGTIHATGGLTDLGTAMILSSPDQPLGWQPGLVAGRLTGNNPPNPTANPGTFGIVGGIEGAAPENSSFGPTGATDPANPWRLPPGPDTTTLVYTGEIWLDGNTTFGENMDDQTRLYITDPDTGVRATVLSDNSWNNVTVGTYVPESGSGWYEFELRFSNGGGEYGWSMNSLWPNSGFGFGIDRQGRGQTDPGNFVYPEDPGDQTVFRSWYDPPATGDITVDPGSTLRVGGFLHGGVVRAEGTLELTTAATSTGADLEIPAGGLVSLGSASIDMADGRIEGTLQAAGGDAHFANVTLAGTNPTIDLGGGQFEADVAVIELPFTFDDTNIVGAKFGELDLKEASAITPSSTIDADRITVRDVLVLPGSPTATIGGIENRGRVIVTGDNDLGDAVIRTTRGLLADAAGLNGDYFDFAPTRDMVGTGPDGEDEWSVFTSVADVQTWRAGRTPNQEAILTGPVDFPAGGGADPSNGNPFTSIGIDVGGDNFVAFWEGGIEIPSGGSYTFFTSSDDGSFVIIDDTMVVKNAEWQGIGASEESGSITLTAGRHSILMGLYEGGGGAGVLASWESADAGIAKSAIPANVLFQSSEPVLGDLTINANVTLSVAGVVDARLVTVNGELFLDGVSSGSEELDLGPAGLLELGASNYRVTEAFRFEINSWIQDGSNGGTWDGTTGIRSSLLQDPNSGLHMGLYQDPQDGWIRFGPTFDNDIDVSQEIDYGEYVILRDNFGGPGTAMEGDFTGDGLINHEDYLWLKRNYGQGMAAGGADVLTVVPEPATLLLIGVALPMILRRRSKKRS